MIREKVTLDADSAPFHHQILGVESNLNHRGWFIGNASDMRNFKEGKGLPEEKMRSEISTKEVVYYILRFTKKFINSITIGEKSKI